MTVVISVKSGRGLCPTEGMKLDRHGQNDTWCGN